MSNRALNAARVARSTAAPRTRRSRARKRLKTLFALLLLLVETAVAIVLVIALVVFQRFTTDELPHLEAIATDIKTPVPTTIWSQDGVLLGRLQVENRQPVTLDEVSKNAINATIAIEDHRFYEHRGVDAMGIARSAWADLRKSNQSQGGSTITQQLVRNLQQFNISKQKKYSRKLREILTALRVEQLYSKPEILTLYLNNIYYGAGAYGIQAAAQTYFGKPARKLDIAESALLAGIPQRPSAYMPYEHRKAALKRRDEVLDRMLQYSYITQAQYDKAKKERPRLIARREHDNFDFKAPYFTTYVLKDLMQRYGPDMVYRGGLKIETTLNWKMQQMAEEAMRNGLDHASGYGANQGALVSLDNHTGYIRAMVGGRSFRADQYNAVTQGRRQPGSAFKVFDYSAAFDTGAADLNSRFMDEPIPYPNDPEGRVVKNYDGSYHYSLMRCLDGIKWSKNTIAVQVAKKVGIETVIAYAHKMGITTELAPYLPTALGASAVRPLDLCSAYSVFPMNGSRCQPMALVRVTDADGNLIEENQPQIENSLLKQDTVDQMNDALQAVVEGGTGTAARGNESNGIVENAHGKTGTTSDNRDAWFAGYTPELSTVIWVASVHRAHKGRALKYAEMPGATGGHLCAPIWHNFMIRAVPEQRKFGPGPEATAYSMPSARTANADSNNLASRSKRRRKNTPSPSDEQNTANAVATDTPDANGETAPPVSAGPSDPAPGQTALNNASPEPPPSNPTPPGGATPIAAAAPSTPVSTAAAEPAPHRRLRSRPPSATEPEMVTVEVCVDSGRRATEWCPTRKTIRVSARVAARMRSCRLHKPPPGEG